MTVNKNHLLLKIWGDQKLYVLSDLNKRARTKFNAAFDNLISRVESHPISQELLQKQTLDESQFLTVKGNLFSFLGFEASQNPVKELISFLKSTVKFRPAKQLKAQGFFGRAEAKAIYPTREDFDFLGLAWEPGRSWVYALEEGVNNLGYYLFVQRAASRSGKGIQSKYQVRTLQFHPIPYLTPILEQFKKELS